MYFYSLVLFALSIFCQHQADATSRLVAVPDILNEPYDRIHEFVVLDQIDDYITPIESLETRTHRSLNGLWNYCLDPLNEGHRSRWFEKSLRDECVPRGDFLLMPVPSAFNDIQSNKTVRNYMGWMWYQTDLRWPQPGVDSAHRKQAGQLNSWVLQIESINYLSLIWVQIIGRNNKTRLVGSHAGGHLPITLDLSDILNSIDLATAESARVGLFANIRLTIAVSNMLTSETIPSGRMLNETDAVGWPHFKFQPDFDFFHFAGIMGDVNLIRLPESYIANVAVTRESARLARIELTLSKPCSTSIQVCWSLNGSTHLRTNHSDSTNDPNLDCTMLEQCSRLQTFLIKATPSSWTSIMILLRGANSDDSWEVHDMVELKLAVRRSDMSSIESLIAFGGERRMHRRQLQGFGMHHEQLFSGRTMSLPTIMKDLNLVKQMGANILRTSHYPYSRAYLDACDELNLLVIAECPAVGLSSFSDTKLKLHKQILREMMERDHGHPSIYMWSLANEPESQHPEARNYFAQLVEYARTELRRFTLDAGRPLTVAIAQSHVDDKIGHLFDVVMVNRYYGWYDCTGLVECVRHSLVASLEGWANKYPGKALMISEFGADTIAGFHSTTSEIFSEEYQRDLLVAHEQVFDELAGDQICTANQTPSGTNVNATRINFLGSMIWNFADFSTHESLMRPGGNRKGVFTRWREPKLAVDSIRQIYSSRSGREPMEARCFGQSKRAPHSPAGSHG